MGDQKLNKQKHLYFNVYKTINLFINYIKVYQNQSQIKKNIYQEKKIDIQINCLFFVFLLCK